MSHDEVKATLDQSLTSKPEKFLKKRPGRPKKFDLRKAPTHKVPQPEQMYEYGELGMTLKHVADALGISYTGIYSLFDQYPILKEEYMRGRGDKVSRNLRKLQEHIDAGKTGPLYFWLERVAGFGTKVDLAVENTDKPPIQLSSDQMRRMAEAVLTSFPDNQAIEVASEEVRQDLAELDTGIEAGVAEGRMLMQHVEKSGRIPGDDEPAEADPAESE